MEGVLETVVGYCGGSDIDPTYKNIKDHTEAIRGAVSINTFPCSRRRSLGNLQCLTTPVAPSPSFRASRVRPASRHVRGPGARLLVVA